MLRSGSVLRAVLPSPLLPPASLLLRAHLLRSGLPGSVRSGLPGSVRPAGCLELRWRSGCRSGRRSGRRSDPGSPEAREGYVIVV